LDPTFQGLLLLLIAIIKSWVNVHRSTDIELLFPDLSSKRCLKKRSCNSWTLA